jgi:uncharacterized membrane protein YeaQ/YmgE (transglycosylase-associated protein family)
MPLAVIVVAVILLFAMVVFLWLAVGILSLVLHLAMAGLVGALADAVVPGSLPWGWVGAILAGLVGSWLGTQLLGHVGPVIFEVPLIPGFVGALILAFGVSLLGKLQANRGRGL